ncbi:MAG: HPt (histidine-containing phosphotransfer) domain-containing protein [Phenylobacterium sp.]|jgi:HPt (histidine-containing phosphotransfer) domain-containing protein
MALIFMIVISLFSGAAVASKTLELCTDLPGIYLAPYVRVLENSDRHLTLEDVQQLQRQGDFQPPVDNNTIIGMTSSAWWLVLDVINPDSASKTFYLETLHPHMDFIDLYRLNPDGNSQVIRSGDRRPLDSRIMGSGTYVFELQVAAQTRQRLYLRFSYAKEGLMDVTMKAWSAEQYYAHKLVTFLFYGFLLAVAALLILYNLVIYHRARKRASIWAVFTILAAVLVFLTNVGIGHRYLWSSSALVIDASSVLFSCCTLALAAQFSRTFLHTKVVEARILKGLMIAAVLTGLLYMFSQRTLMFNALLLLYIGFATLPLLGMLAYKRGQIEARWFVVAWSIWSVAIILSVMRLSGLVPPTELTQWFLHSGMLLTTIMLAFALVDQVAQMRRERMADEKQTQQTLLLTNQSLKKQMHERTKELKEARARVVCANQTKSDFLASMSHQIRSPMNPVIDLSTLAPDSKPHLEQSNRSASNQSLNKRVNQGKAQASQKITASKGLWPETLAGIDVKAGIARTDGDPVLFYHILAGFPSWGVQRLNDIRTALANGNKTAVARAAHALRGTAVTISASKVALAAADLETGIDDADEAQTSALLNQVEVALEQVLNSISSLDTPTAPLLEKRSEISTTLGSELPAVAVAPDEQALRALVVELKKLLEQSDFKATKVFNKIRHLYDNQALPVTLSRTARRIDAMDFEGAASCLGSFADAEQ